MSSYREYACEKEQIDAFMMKGYDIRQVTESLDGAVVIFAHPDNREDRQQLIIQTADARKYLTTILFEKQKRLSS